MLVAEAQARRAKLNFWSQASPLMPWNCRQGLTSSPPYRSQRPCRLRQCRFENPSGAAVIVPRIWIIRVAAAAIAPPIADLGKSDRLWRGRALGY